MIDAVDAKTVLRSAMRSRRRALGAASPDAGVKAATAYARSPLRARTAALYLPHGGEFDPLPLVPVLTDSGMTLCLPVVTGRDSALAFRVWSPGDAMAVDALGLPCPAQTVAPCSPELIVVPLLAFDRAGRRLGQGGGYYDRTLAERRAAGPVFALGLAFAGQEVDSLAEAEHDQPLDAILTEDGLIVVNQGAA